MPSKPVRRAADCGDGCFYCAGTVTCAVSLMKTFQSVRFRTFRACLFAGLGLWGIVPGMHALILFGKASPMRSAFTIDACMGIDYLVTLSSTSRLSFLQAAFTLLQITEDCLPLRPGQLSRKRSRVADM